MISPARRIRRPGQQARRTVTNAEHELIVNTWLDGRSLADIACAFGWIEETIRLHLRIAGVWRPRRHPSQARLEARVLSLAWRGHSGEEIAAQLRLPPTRVARFMEAR